METEPWELILEKLNKQDLHRLQERQEDRDRNQRLEEKADRILSRTKDAFNYTAFNYDNTVVKIGFSQDTRKNRQTNFVKKDNRGPYQITSWWDGSYDEEQRCLEFIRDLGIKPVNGREYFDVNAHNGLVFKPLRSHKWTIDDGSNQYELPFDSCFWYKFLSP
tara:strand:+ start:892 stop:1380 length:489 start_codon:yes stop_codon:yes gene_type:complete